MSHTGLFCTFFLLTTGRKKQKERPFFVRPIAPHTVFSLERDGAITFISLELHTLTHTKDDVIQAPAPVPQTRQTRKRKKRIIIIQKKKKKLDKYARESLRATQRHFKHGRDVNKLTPVITIPSAVFPV